MLSAADTALDLLVLELLLQSLLAGIGAGVLLVLAPVDAGAEDDVLTHGGGVGGRALGVLDALAELGPCFAVGDAGVHGLGMCGVADATSGLDLVAGIVVAEGDDGLCAVLVGNGLGRGEIGAGLLVVVVVGPILPFGGVSYRSRG